jgi:hypothetical protein
MATQTKKRTSSRSHAKSEVGSSSKRSSSAARSNPGTRSASRSSGAASARSKAPARKASGSRGASGARKASGQSTTDHEQIRGWVEERGGKPACVRGTGGKNDTGMLRIDMPGYSGADKLAPIPWDQWFEKFDEKGLAFLYQDTTAGGKKSNFNKLVNR